MRRSMNTTQAGFPWGLSQREIRFLRSLTPAWRIQKFLDEIDYDVHAEGCRSPRRVMRERKAQCLDGALFAAAALRVQGHRPLLFDLEAEHDDDHVVAIFRQNGAWGAIARSNYSGLRFREPIYRTLRELALSYFESYFNLRRQKSLRRYSGPVDLRRFDAESWMTSEQEQRYIAEYLVDIPHRDLLTPAMRRDLAPVDRRLFEAGKLGRA